MIQPAPVYNDIRSLSQLEAGARERSPEAMRETARQFEALFVQMMLKSMREAGAVFAEDRDRTYDEMFDQQIALELTREKGIGIAELLVRQLGGTGGQEEISAADQNGLRERMESRAPTQDVAVATEAEPPAPPPAAERADFRPGDPESFLQAIWPLAKQAAARLGVDARALAAQATLETGWGQRLLRDEDGVSGNNLFGIKADERWDGESLGVATLEYADGVARREFAQFRAYPNLEAGFADYVNFLRENPRYREAVGGGLNASEYARSLQDAGYATDPDYARKITEIMDSPRFDRAVASLKNRSDTPTQL